MKLRDIMPGEVSHTVKPHGFFAPPPAVWRRDPDMRRKSPLIARRCTYTNGPLR